MKASTLTDADTLRLNMLLTQPLQAVRIDESKLVVRALSERGEMSVTLNPDCREELYLKRVRELLSSHYLGSPGGYPVYLQRWTRMGQARAGSLEKLLLIGEVEAAVAVVHAPALDAELARRVWWAYPTAANARQMLQREAVANTELGAELVRFLLDYLPFETEHLAMIDSIRLMLRAGTLDDVEIERLWAQSRRKTTYVAGFLAAGPQYLPTTGLEPHPKLQALPPSSLDTVLGRMLERLLSTSGQAFLEALARVLRRPADQDVVVVLFEAMEAYFADLRDDRANCRDAQALTDRAGVDLDAARAAGDALAIEETEWVHAMLTLAHAGEQLVAPILGRSDAVGSVLRNQLKPVSDPVWQALDRLSVRPLSRQ